MDRDTAVARINDGIGFRATGHSLTERVILRLQEAQRNLERGKTLPKFLLQETQLLTLASAAHTVALPAGFLREYDDEPIHYTSATSDIPIFLKSKQNYADAVLANTREDSDPAAPQVYIIRNSVIDFITIADQAYSLYWSYYAKAALLTSNIENVWLADDSGSAWLIGEAGLRIARDLRDAAAIQIFGEMRTEGRAALFGDLLAAEDAGGNFVMGAEN